MRSCLGSRCQSLATLTCRSRKTGLPRMRSIWALETRPDLAEPRTLVADDDALLAVALDIDAGPHVDEWPIIRTSVARHHLLDHDGERVRHLVVHALQRCLADHLGDQGLLRLVGQLSLRVQGRALRKGGDEEVGEQLDLVAGDRRDGHDLAPGELGLVTGALDGHQVLGQTVGRDEVGLGGDGQHRLASQPGDLAHEEAVAWSDALVGGQAQADGVDFRPGRTDEVVEPLPQCRPWLVQPGGVDQHELRVVTVHQPPDGVPGGLRLRRRDGDLAAHDGVGKRRLPGVGPADETGEARAESARHEAPERQLVMKLVPTGSSRRRWRGRPEHPFRPSHERC